jgi:hypothetical protein
MKKEIIIDRLRRYDYKFVEQLNTKKVKLGFSLEIEIEFTEDDKILIHDRLKSWNILTGVFEMSVKSSLIFNAVFALFNAFIFLLLRTMNESSLVETMTLFVLLIELFWILLWTPYFIIKSENFRRFIENINE